MTDNEILYRDLTVNELTEKQAAITKRLAELAPAVSEVTQLKEDAERVKLAMTKYRAEHGEPSSEELWSLMLFVSSKPELHDSLSIWLDNHTLGDQISMAPDADNEWGSSDFYMVPFMIDLSQGIDSDLIHDIETVSVLFSTLKRDKVVFRANIFTHLIVTVDKRDSTYAAYSTSDYSGIWSSYHGNEPTTIALALDEVREMLNKPSREKSSSKKAERKKLFGLF